MAGEIASAWVSVMASFKGGGSALSRELSGQGAAAGDAAGRASASHFGSTFSSRVSALSGTVAKGIGLAFGGIAIAGATIGLKTAAGMEQAKIAFTTMLGSGEKADAFLKQLATFAAKTPFEFPELQTAASSLISVGVSANDVIPIMTTLGNVTSGMGTGAEGVQRATVALQQMSAAGKITGEDLNQLRDAGVPVFDLLAAATGKSKAEVAGLAAAGKLGSKELGELFDALKSGKGLERFNGLMEKQSHSLVGVMSTLKDTVSQNLAAAFQPIIPILEDLIPKIATFSGTVLGGLSKGLAGAIGWLQHANFAGAGFLAGFKRMFAVVAGFLVQNKGLFEIWGHALVGAFRTVGGWVVKALGGIRSFLTSNSATWQDWAYSIMGIVTKLGILVGSVVARIQALWAKHGDQIMAVVSEAWDVVKTVVSTGLLVITGAISAVTAIVNGDWTNTWAAVQGIVKNALAGLQHIFGPFTPLVVGLTAAFLAYKAVMAGVSVATRIAAAATKAWSIAQGIFNAVMDANPIVLVAVALIGLVAGLVYAYKHFEGFRKIVDSVFSAVRHIVGTVVNTIKGFFADNAATITSWGQKIKTIVMGVVDAFVTLFKASVAVITTELGIIRAVVTTVLTALAAFWAAHGAQILATVTAVFTAIWNVVQVAFTLVKSIITGALNIIAGIISTVMAVIHGDWSGVWDGIQQILTGVWQIILATIEGALGVLAAIIPAALSALGTLWSIAWDGIESATSAAIGAVITYVQGIPGRILGALGSLLGLLTGVGTDVITGLFNAIVIKFIDVGGFFLDLPGKILGFVGDLGHLLYDAGQNVIQGLIDGIGSMIGKVGDVMGGIASKVRGFLPFSPAKEGPLRSNPPDKAGRKIGQMLAAGMLDEAAVVARAAGVLANAVQFNTGGLTVSAPRGTSTVRPFTVDATARSGDAPLTVSQPVYAPSFNTAPGDSRRQSEEITRAARLGITSLPRRQVIFVPSGKA